MKQVCDKIVEDVSYSVMNLNMPLLGLPTLLDFICDVNTMIRTRLESCN